MLQFLLPYPSLDRIPVSAVFVFRLMNAEAEKGISSVRSDSFMLSVSEVCNFPIIFIAFSMSVFGG
jgi:hypothetical protein